MILKEFHQEVLKQTHEDAQKHAKRLFIIGSSLSVLFTFMFYLSGIFENDPRYQDVPLSLSLAVMLLQNWVAVMIVQIILTYLKCFGKTTGSRVMDWYPNVVFGFWNFVDRCYGIISNLILQEHVKQKISEDIWYYQKLHSKHDPIYKAELDALRSESAENKTKNDERFDAIESELQRLLEENAKTKRDLRISERARSKLRNLRNQAERERDIALREVSSKDRTIRVLLATIFRLELIIKKLKGE